MAGLGCGEFLVSLSLEELCENSKYDLVVLQATPLSIPFYSRFGFVRVGAVCRYANNPAHVVGYRHWTYKDEKHLSKHGGPSYMMCLDLGPLRAKGKLGLKKAVRGMIVEDKPDIVVKEASDMKYTQRDVAIQVRRPGYVRLPGRFARC